MQDSIVKKLNLLLSREQHLEECHVVYLFVEMRKLLEKISKQKAMNFKLLQFYCNWVVHTKKSRDLSAASPFLDQLEESIRAEKGKVPVEFIDLSHLKQQCHDFFSELEINKKIVSTQECWQAFCTSLVDILIDQPIEIDRGKTKTFFYFTKRSATIVLFNISFSDRAEATAIINLADTNKPWVIIDHETQIIRDVT